MAGPFIPESARTVKLGFDQDYRLTSLVDTGTNPVQNLAYAYYPTNNVKTITDGINSADSQSFVYDSLQRLTQATGSYGTYGYTYDKDGNRLTQTLGSTTTTYGYGAGNDRRRSGNYMVEEKRGSRVGYVACFAA